MNISELVPPVVSASLVETGVSIAEVCLSVFGFVVVVVTSSFLVAAVVIGPVGIVVEVIAVESTKFAKYIY